MMQKEPTLIIEFVRSLLGAGVLFGLSLSDKQAAALLLVASLGLALWNRSRVTPAGKVAPNAASSP